MQILETTFLFDLNVQQNQSKRHTTETELSTTKF